MHDLILKIHLLIDWQMSDIAYIRTEIQSNCSLKHKINVITANCVMLTFSLSCVSSSMLRIKVKTLVTWKWVINELVSGFQCLCP